jgi:hypothetical protein
MTVIVDPAILVVWAFDEVNAVASESTAKLRRRLRLSWFEVLSALIQS